jgi:hypothetical protein
MNVRIGLLLLSLLVPLLLLTFVLAWWSRRSRSPLELDASRYGALLAAHRKAVGWRWAGLGLGVVAASVIAVTVTAGFYNLGAILAPTVFGLCVMGGVVVGELSKLPRRQGVRTAALETRTVGGYLPRRLSGVVAASAFGLGALLVTTTLLGTEDGHGNAGRILARQCTPISVSYNGPWPGSFYSVPLGIAVVAGLLAAAIALRTVVLRPHSGSDPELAAADDVLRRWSAEAVVAATGVMVAASLSGVALVASLSLHRLVCPPVSWAIFGLALAVVGALMLLLTAWCLAVLLVGGRFVPADSGAPAVARESVRR